MDLTIIDNKKEKQYNICVNVFKKEHNVKVPFTSASGGMEIFYECI